MQEDTPPPTQTETPQPSQTPEAPQPIFTSGETKSRKKLWIALTVVLVLLVGAGAYWLGTRNSSTPINSTNSTNKTTTSNVLTLDESKNYGNKYADGILPVGDDKYSSSGAKQGYIYACEGYARNLSNDPGGADTRGPWFTNSNSEYDINKKLKVAGSVNWQSVFSNTVSGDKRTISTNDLPTHATGVFPIASSDPAYQYDRNPNSIKEQTLAFTLSANPTYQATPNCMGGQSGIMLTGVVLNNALDAGGRDAGAWEVQDSCGGHPQNKGEYHYHTLSSCISDISVHTVIGYALDGFPITGPQLAKSNILTTSDLDECHGITGKYTVNGKTTTGYHYVMTQDFPYSVSCFRGTANTAPAQ